MDDEVKAHFIEKTITTRFFWISGETVEEAQEEIFRLVRKAWPNMKTFSFDCGGYDAICGVLRIDSIEEG